MWEGIAADSPEQWTTNLAQASRQYAAYRESHLPSQAESRERPE
jgi:hypothetical protein